MTLGEGARARPTFVLDVDRCIGCWACAVACRMKNELPDGVWWVRVETIGGAARDTSQGTFPKVHKQYRPVIERCTYSPEDIAIGRQPACAAACPTDVFEFGDSADPLSSVSTTIQSVPTTPADAPPAGRLAVRYRSERIALRQRRSGG